MRRWVAAAALCAALGQAGAQGAPQGALRTELAGDDPERARAAAARLGALRDDEALLDALALGLPSEVAAAALEALRPSRAALDVLLGYARHRAPELRARALPALARIDDRRARAAVLAGLGDQDAEVRAAAGAALAERRERAAVEPLLLLLRRGDAAAAAPLAALADAEVARTVAELAGQVPDALLAATLGGMLARPGLGPESAYVALARALGAIPGEASLAALEDHAQRAPRRASGKEARAVLDRRRGTP
jgi:hypothetical protein